VGQAAEIADGKSRYRLNRVFSTKQLESPEETVKRYWRRAAEQPQACEFIKDETKGIDRALERLRANVRYRIERQPGTIETSWQELRAVLQDRIQSLVSAMETGDAGAVKEMLGDVMYTMCAARDDDGDGSEGVAALSMWDEIMFHAVKVGVTFEGMQKEEEVVADTGAAPLLVSETRLSVEVMKRSLVPGRARVMHSASAHRVKTRGGALLNFRLSGCRQTFSHEWQVTEGATTPTILGVSFWAKYKAQFDFKDRVIRMWVNGAETSVPFTIGDEVAATDSTQEEKEVPLYALEDTVVQPGHGYMVPAKPTRGHEENTRAWDTWAITPTTDEEAEEMMRRLQEEEGWHERIDTRAREQAAERAAAMRRQAEQSRRWDDGIREMEARIQGDEWEELGHRVTQWHLIEDLEEEEEERECRAEQLTEELRRSVGNGAAQAITHPRWHTEFGSVIPVSGINCDNEPMVIRRGDRVAVGTKLAGEQVARVEEQAGASFVYASHEEVEQQAKEEGTTSSSMIKDIEHKEGDWRRGKTWKELVEATKSGEREKQFQVWKEKMRDEIKIGEEEDKDMTEDVKDIYRRLIFAYQGVIASNPKKPGIIPGIYHRILLEDGTRPCRERIRSGAPAEEKIKEDEIKMLIENDIVEECNSEWSSNLVVVRKKDGTPRTCVDLRKVNMATRFDCFPLARIDESLDALGGAKYLSTLDNSSAFWSILLHPEDRDKTAFGTRSHGQLRFRRMPFGLTNATATYARALTFVLRGLLWKSCVAYCDDTVLWGKTFDEHMESLHAVLKRYDIHNVNVKISKCHFACSKTEFVGHQVEVGAGVKVCQKKVKAILEMEKPRTVQQLKSFIGMCSYYKRFIKDFAHIAMPLRRIENVYKSKTQPIDFLWRDNQQKAFNALKAALATAPVLAFPDFSKPMIVISDCSDTAKGAVLCQNFDGIEKPIMYISQALNEHELKYGITDKEGCAATWAIRRTRPPRFRSELASIGGK